jgi:hypothetical protein
VENPFTQRAFITERQSILAGVPREGAADDTFAYYLFETDSMVSKGKGYMGFGFRTGFVLTGLCADFHRSHQYTVDHKKGKIRIGDNLEYYYEFKGSVLRLWNMTESHTLYEVGVPFFLADQNSVYWQTVNRHNSLMNKDYPNPLNMEYDVIMAHQDRDNRLIKDYVDSLVAKAKITTDPYPTPTPTPPPSPTNNVTNITLTNVTLTNVTVTNATLTNVIVTNEGQTVVVQNGSGTEGGNSGEPKNDDAPPGTPSKELTVDDLINGQYQGSFVNETKGTTSKFDLRIGPLSEPAGNPPKARISGVINFEDGRSDKGLQGEAVYADKTTFTLGWNNSTGTVAYNGTLEGDNLRGTWRMDGANGEKSNGTFDAVRTGP